MLIVVSVTAIQALLLIRTVDADTVEIIRIVYIHISMG